MWPATSGPDSGAVGEGRTEEGRGIMTNLIDLEVAKAELESRVPSRHPGRRIRTSSSLEIMRRTLRRSRREELHQRGVD